MGCLSPRPATRAALRFAFNSCRFALSASAKKYYFFEPFNRGALNPIIQKAVRSSRLVGDTLFVPFHYYVHPEVPDASLFVISAHVATMYLWVEHGVVSSQVGDTSTAVEEAGARAGATPSQSYAAYGQHPRALFEAAYAQYESNPRATACDAPSHFYFREGGGCEGGSEGKKEDCAPSSATPAASSSAASSPSLAEVLRSQGWVLAPRTYGGDPPQMVVAAEGMRQQQQWTHSPMTFGERTEPQTAATTTARAEASTCDPHSQSQVGKLASSQQPPLPFYYSHRAMLLDGGTAADVPLVAAFVDYLNTSLFAPAPFRARNRARYWLLERRSAVEGEGSASSSSATQTAAGGGGGGGVRRYQRRIDPQSLLSVRTGLVGTTSAQAQLVREWLPPRLPPQSNSAASRSASVDAFVGDSDAHRALLAADGGLHISLVCCTHAHPDHSGGASRYSRLIEQRAEEGKAAGGERGGGGTNSKDSKATDTCSSEAEQQQRHAKALKYRRGVPILIHPKAREWYRGVGGLFQWAMDVALAVLVSLTANPRGPAFSSFYTVPVPPPRSAAGGGGFLSKVKGLCPSFLCGGAKQQRRMVFGVTGGEAISLRGGLDEPSSSSAAAGHAFALSSAPPKASSASTATTTATTNAVASQQPTLPSPASRHWHIISAPGHTDHMYLLYFPRGRLLYVSDMMILNNGYFKRLKRKRGAESRAKMAAAMARAHGAVAGAFEDARRLRKEKKGGKKKRLGLMGRISMLMTSVESEGAAAAKNTTAKGAAAAAATTPSSTTNAASSPAASATAASTTTASSRAAKRRAHHYANNANAFFLVVPFLQAPPI